jgi:hypothetical protein
LRIELKRLEMDIRCDLTNPGQRLLKGVQSDRAPWAGDVGHKINLDALLHLTANASSAF